MSCFSYSCLRLPKRLAALVSLSLSVLWCAAQSLSTHVDPRIGSEGVGRVFVGPCAPFGMAKPGPDAVSMPNAGWAPLPERVKGFSQTHVSGTGGGQKYGNVLIQPIMYDDAPGYTGLLLPSGAVVRHPVYSYQRRGETVSLGHYACTYDNGVRTEVTASDRCALYRITGATGLMVDVASFLGMDTIPNKREAQQFVASAVEVTSLREVVGSTTVRGGWNNGDAYTVYFALQTDVPMTAAVQGGPYFVKARFAAPQVNVKVGISYVSIDQARRNIMARDFDAQRRVLTKAWEAMLARVPYQGTDKEMRMFYTALYHTLLMPIDKTGENPKWEGGDYYDDYYALWDTYRTSFPLLMDYYPERAVPMVNALLNIYRHEGYMPDARSGDCNGRTQGGSHGEVVIADAFARGLKGIDYELALQAMLKDAEVPPADDEKEGRGGLELYNRLGYVPYGIARAGTRTVEYSFDDWCIAQVARGLGHDDLYHRYMARSRNWRKLWRDDYEWQGMRGFILPRDASGRWLDSVPWGKSKVFHPLIPYKPDTKVAPWHIAWWDTFFYEALSAEYSLSVPHDVPTLIGLCGGEEAFRQRLDTFFDNGHYNVGNEPSFLTPYLYHYIGRPDLSAQRVSQIVNRYFSDTPDGLPGNDDSGAMSAWLVWAMLGKYPVASPDPSGIEKASPDPSGRRGDQHQAHYLSISPVRIATSSSPSTPSSPSIPSSSSTPSSPSTAPIPHGSPLLPEGSGEANSIPEGLGEASVSFTLNRQYRTWPMSTQWEGDTLRLTCNGCTYLIPKTVVDHATGFCWESAYRPGRTYVCEGTFLFISRAAYDSLLTTGQFVYDGITWREYDRDNGLIRVKADVDGTEMWIETVGRLPMVRKMKNNPLGIDWTMTFN